MREKETVTNNREEIMRFSYSKKKNTTIFVACRWTREPQRTMGKAYTARHMRAAVSVVTARLEFLKDSASTR